MKVLTAAHHLWTRWLGLLAITLGHVGLVNLLLKTNIGERLLSPFKAAGRTAFSLYLLQTIIGVWILFPSWGLGLWGRLGTAGLAGLATIVIISLPMCGCASSALAPLNGYGDLLQLDRDSQSV